MNKRIDVIIGGKFGTFVFKLFGNHNHLNADREDVESSHDESLSSFPGGDQAMVVDGRGKIIVRLKNRQFGDIPSSSIRIMCKH